MTDRSSRRHFLKRHTVAGVAYWAAARTASAQQAVSPERLRVAAIGAGGQGRYDIRMIAAADADIVALCDVDDNRAGQTYKDYPGARRFTDFRQMFDVMHKDIDAVVVSTPDHTHAVATMMAMTLGKHVYTQKPLTHDVFEARMLAQVARKQGVVTQMGNQGTAEAGFREAVEVVQSGAIGHVREVHCWTNRPGRWWRQGAEAVVGLAAVKSALHGSEASPDPVPGHLNWDLWLGTAPARPYQAEYLPKKWRGWWDFGCGALGDMGCHTANMPFMACKLGHPISIQAESSERNSETLPVWSVIRYEFPARADLPPLTLTWYDGGDDKPGWVDDRLRELAQGKQVPPSGSLLVGGKGTLFSPNDMGNEYQLLPEKDFEGFQPPSPRLPRSPGHYKEWVEACKADRSDMPMSNFSYAGLFTETVLLGCVAMRAGKKILWDGPGMQITNDAQANQFLRREYRQGWSL